jgi:hypothetical protein
MLSVGSSLTTVSLSRTPGQDRERKKRSLINPGVISEDFPIFFFFAELGLELRAYTLSHSISPFL